MIIPKFIIDQSIINAEIRVLNSLLCQQRQLKKTLVLYLEKISDSILNATDMEDATSLVSCLDGIKKSFENIKDNIDKLLELREFLYEASKLTDYDSKYFEKYNEDYIKIFEKITEDNIFYYSFMESILKHMSVVFPEFPPVTKETEKNTNEEIVNNEEVIETYDFNLKDMVAEELLKETNLLEEFAAIAKETLEHFEEIEKFSSEKEISSSPSNDDMIEIEIETNNIQLNNDINNEEISIEVKQTVDTDFIQEAKFEELEKEFDALMEKEDNKKSVNNDKEIEINLEKKINSLSENIEEISSTSDPEEPSIIPGEISQEELNAKLEQELEEELNRALRKDFTIIEDDNEESQEFNIENNNDYPEKTLLFSEKNNNIILPYSTEDLEEFFSNNPEKYSSIQDIIDKEYTLPFDFFKNAASARFKETYYLAKHKSNLSVVKATALASELYFNSQVDPAIIRACKNIEELYSYLACLERNNLDDFKYFKIVYN